MESVEAELLLKERLVQLGREERRGYSGRAHLLERNKFEGTEYALRRHMGVK